MKCHKCGSTGCYREGVVCVDGSELLSILEEDRRILVTSSLIEKEYYCKLTRIEEVIEFAERMGYKKIGMAFCIGLLRESRIAAQIFESHDFSVYSVVCKVGSVDKSKFKVSKLEKGKYEAICNPIVQAKTLNDKGTELNIVIGLCVGHDILFQKYSEAPVTVLVVKDRVLAHNPVGALNSPYYTRRLIKNI